MPAFSNGWNINRGTLIVGSTAAGALGTSDAANTVRLNGGVTLQLSTAGNANYSGGKIISTDNNTLTLDYGGGSDRVQTYAGGLDLNAYGGNGPLGSALALRVSNSRDKFTFLGPVTLNADAQLNVANSSFISGGTNRVIFAGGLTGTNRTLNKFGNGALVLTADSSATFTGGAFRVLAGTLGVERNGALGDATSTASVAEGAVLEVGYGVTNFTPLATVAQDGGSAERWLHPLARFAGATNPQTYVVPTNVNLQFVGNLTGLTNKTIRLNGGSIEAYNFSDATNGTLLGTGLTIELGADSKIGTSGVDLGRAGIIFTNQAPITEVGGPRSLTKIGLDTVILTTNSTYTGNTTVQQGILRLGTNDAFTSVGILSVTNQGVFDLASFNQSASGLAGNGYLTNSVATNQPALRVAIGVSNLFRGDLGGRFDLIKTGDGDLTLGGTGTGTGSRQVYGGTLYVGADTIGNSGPLGSAGASVFLFDSFTSANLLTLGPYLVPQQITVDNNFSGGTKTIGGLTAGTTTFTGPLLLLDNVYINAAAGGRVNYTGSIIESSPVGITKVGGGVLNLTGNNNYSGQTTVAEGTLLVNSTVGSGTGASFVYLGTGTTLGGSGRIGGSVQLDYGAFFKPGN
ncbi:MAG: autotransporter-associated beta strand repeat-containing protein [Verrucomicrobia bacterium]|nr:autotransporter-associated beta strand repeat-containing protein [Verrucomicrobiota bacterium]